MTDEHRVDHTGDAARGRYFIDLGDGYEAEMTYIWRDGVMIVNHTGVPRQFEGKGLALKLVKRAVADAGERGFTINPVCPYVDMQFRRHRDWAPLRAD